MAPNSIIILIFDGWFV